MSQTFASCVLISFAWMALFFLWGKCFLVLIRAKRDIASSILFGYLVLQFLYQIIYLPFYLIRGSYRTLSYIWIAIVIVVSVFLIVYLHRHLTEKSKDSLKTKEKVGFCIAIVMVLGLAFYISLRVPLYGADTKEYISEMNQCYYKDSIKVLSGVLSFHSGMNSLFEFYTISSLITGIRPYYISLFTVRIVGVCLHSLTVYRIGRILFQKDKGIICWPALYLSVIVPYLLMLWGSNYTAEFFYWRINEAKGYCQFILLPLGFSVILEMFKKDIDRNILWKEQLMIGLSAIAVSASSLTPYLFLILMGTFAVLAHDQFRNGYQTLWRAAFCALPNLLYLIVYILEKKSIIVF